MVGITGKQSRAITTKESKNYDSQNHPACYLAICIVATVILTVPIYFVLEEFTDSDMALD